MNQLPTLISQIGDDCEQNATMNIDNSHDCDSSEKDCVFDRLYQNAIEQNEKKKARAQAYFLKEVMLLWKEKVSNVGV